MTTHVATRIATWCVLGVCWLAGVPVQAQPTPLADTPIRFLDQEEIQGADAVVVPGNTILIGEIHGTWEAPVVVANLVRQAVAGTTETILCIEVSSSEQASLDRFLASDGGAEARTTLLEQPHWANHDGRASVGMFAMLELVRRLRSEGKPVRVVAIDSAWTVPEGDIASLPPEKLRQLEEQAARRDEEMARAVIHERETSAEAIVIAFAGNVHTRIAKGTAWDPDYLPMGWHVSQKVKALVSLDIDHADGQAWVTTDRGSGPTRFAGQDRGPNPFVELLDDADTGYHGRLYVGRITAARPAVGDIWISPDGDDGHPGTEHRPRRSLEAAIAAVGPGHTIWLLPGTYAFTDTVQIPKTKRGTAAAPYRLAGRRGLPRPKLDFTGVSRSSEIRGLQIDGQYWHLCYLEIYGASDNNVNVAGSNNLLELLDIHDAGDTGLQINSTSSLLPSHNRILNCDSYLNADTSAEDADGFAAKLIIGPGNSFEGCRAWHNCDDNWDLYDAQAVVTLKACWAIEARHPTKSRKNSDGNGFKLGGIRKESSSWNKRNAFASYAEYVQANDNPHVLEGCFAIGNPAWGFHRNGNPSTRVTCRDCGAWDNGKGSYSDGLQVVGEDASAPSVTAAAAIAAERDEQGNLPAMRSLVPTGP